ncbi:hypothetical protein BB561_004518 [Smittium simulii]|uniref:Uncharacterized protein n=1 Tax=Smittium simulii TaxID=133385 RepID=A0A2T9YFT2_9FUNG|nr:hypothetical protein BB561_004518 [Smittium simulii]
MDKLIQVIKDLSKKVKILNIKRENRNTVQIQQESVEILECNNPHTRFRAPIVELETYPKLLEAIPCLKKDFFRACISEEARKELIYGSAKFCGMNYNPPPINENASLAVKKMDSAMYGVQSMLVNLTRPMSQYVHNKLRMEPNTNILNNRDLEHNLMIREMIADIDAHITQLRIEHVKQMNMLVAAKKAEKRSAVRNTTRSRNTFSSASSILSKGVSASLLSLVKAHRQPVDQEHCRKEVKNPIQTPQYVTANFGLLIKESDDQFERVFGANAPRCFNNLTRSKANATPKLIQEKNYIGGKRDSDNGSGNSSLKESHRRSKNKNSWVLQSTICNTKENRGTQTSPGTEETQLSCRREKLQDGVTKKNIPDHTQKGLHDVSGLRRYMCAYSDTSNMQEVSKVYLEWKCIPIQSSSIWVVIKSTYVHQSTETINRVGTATKNQSISILDNLLIMGKTKEICLTITHLKMVLNTKDVTLKVPASKVRDLRREAPKLIKTNSTKPGKLYRKGTGYVNSTATGTTDVEMSPRIEKKFSRKNKTIEFAGSYNRTNTIESMELSVISSGDAQNRSIYRRQQHSLWNCSNLAVLLRLMEPVTGVDAYQRQRVIDYIICTTAKECGWLLFVSLFRQHYNISLCKEVWGNILTQIARNFGKYLEALHKHQHQTASNIRTVSNESRGCSQQADGSNRMVNNSSDVYNTEQDIRNSQRGSICVLQECKNKKLLQLVCRSQCSGSKRTNLQLTKMDQPILHSIVELDCTSYTKGKTKKNIVNNHNAVLENSNVVPRSYGTFNATASTATSNNSDSRSQKRKIAALEKQTLALSGLEDQRRAFKNQGLKDYAVEFIVSNKRRVRRRTRYSAAQQRFLDWRLFNKIVGDITAPQIINYLAEIYTADNFRLNTIRANKSAIMGLVKYLKEINNSQSFVKPEINILPVLNTLSNWGLNSELSVKYLTKKLAWLLAVTGMLKASNIYRIDDARSQIINGTLHLVIVAPKEKRGVKVYTEYKLRVAFTLCPTPHVNNDSLIVNRLLRQLNNYSKPLAVDSITRYIQKLSILIARPDNTSVPKARAIGATLAASAGASTDDIVNHAFWSNYSMFDEYYRLSRNLTTNLTESILSRK